MLMLLLLHLCHSSSVCFRQTIASGLSTIVKMFIVCFVLCFSRLLESHANGAINKSYNGRGNSVGSG